jgi:hypothetical protein
MTACALGLVLLIHQWKEHQPLRPLAWLVLTWTACSLVVALISRLTLSPGTNRFMLQYWQGDFMPPPWRDLGALLWLPGKIFELLAYAVAGLDPDSSIEFVFVGIFAALMLIGVPHLMRQEPKLAVLLSVPLIAGVCASALYILPLASRVALYVAPTLLIAAVAGIDFMHARSHGILRQGIATAALALALTASVGFLLLRPPPHRREEARPVLREMSSRWKPSDEIYALDGARLAMEYYGSRFGLSSWIQGDRHDGDFVAHLREVDALRGNERAWLFYTHPRFCEKEVTRGYLETIGVEIDRIEDPYGNLGTGEAAAFLYNLSDPERLERSSPEAFSIDAVEWCRRGARRGDE